MFLAFLAGRSRDRVDVQMFVCRRRRQHGLALCKSFPTERVCQGPADAHHHHGVAVVSLEENVAGPQSGPVAVRFAW